MSPEVPARPGAVNFAGAAYAREVSAAGRAGADLSNSRKLSRTDLNFRHFGSAFVWIALAEIHKRINIQTTSEFTLSIEKLTFLIGQYSKCALVAKSCIFMSNDINLLGSSPKLSRDRGGAATGW